MMTETLNFHVEFLKERYFKHANLPWEFQTPVTKEMVDLVLQKCGVENLIFDFDRGSPQSYTLSIQTDHYLPEKWQALKQEISTALG